MGISEADSISREVHERVVEAFATGWSRPHPHAWDALLDMDVDLHQPLLKSGVGRGVWQEEVGRLLTLIPDLTGQIRSWAGRGDVVFIDIECTGTVGGRVLSFRAVDRLTITATGSVVRRDSFFDPIPVGAQVLSRPRAWVGWWRSGVGPLLSRRRLLPTRKEAL